MTRSEFIEALKIQTSDAATLGTIANLERPPGRKPRERDVRLSQWYGKLPTSDQESVKMAVREAAELAIFSFLGILDGVSAIENGPDKGELNLAYIKSGEELLLNDPSKEFLHDLYNYLCQTSDPIAPAHPGSRIYEVDSAKGLRAKQTSKDGLDLHSVSTVEGNAPASPDTPSIALPKNEHRKM